MAIKIDKEFEEEIIKLKLEFEKENEIAKEFYKEISYLRWLEEEVIIWRSNANSKDQTYRIKVEPDRSVSLKELV